MLSGTKQIESTHFGFDPRELPGATRIGLVWLHVPPINIHFSNVKFEREMTTLRQSSSNYIKSGRGLLQFDMDLVFSGVNMINTKLAKIIGQIRRSPFTMMRNSTVQKMISYNPNANEGGVDIPIAVTGYTINTETNLPDTIIMRLSFIVFNYKPYLNSMQYMKQIINQDGTFDIVPTPRGIEDSNLYRQYVEGNPFDRYIIDFESIQDFMFAGELQYTGTHTDALNRSYQDKLTSTVNQVNQSPGSVTSRTEVYNGDILRNGSRIRKVSNSRYVNEKQELVLGYHVFETSDALDLRLGGYMSRQTQRWIFLESDRRADILSFLSIPDTGQNLEVIVRQNLPKLAGLPAVNNASLGGVSTASLNKYVKKFRLQSDGTTSILGIAVRHTLPLSILPIVSNPMPTVQYLGGSASTITITMETTNEQFVETLTAVDQTIEASARHIRRHSGSELTYVDNDIINLNGTFVVDTSDLDIQSKEDNPGCYIITYILREQAEVMNTFGKGAEEIPSLKRKLIYSLLRSPYAANWQYQSTYTTDGKLNLDPPSVLASSGSANLSYLYLMIFPSWVRTIRNAFLLYYAKVSSFEFNTAPMSTVNPKLSGGTGGLDVNNILEQQLKISNSLSANFGTTAGASAAFTPSVNVERLMFENPGITALEIATATVGSNSIVNFLSNVGFSASAYQRTIQLHDAVTSLQRDIFNNRALAYNQIWGLMTGQHSASSSDQLYLALSNFLMTAFVNNNGTPSSAGTQDAIVQGVAELLASSDNRRWEALLRSPRLLEYELRLATGDTAGITEQQISGITPPISFTAAQIAGDKTGLLKIMSEFFSNSYSTLRAYPDLGLPFAYAIEDNKGQIVQAIPPKNGIPNSIKNSNPNVDANGDPSRTITIDFDQPCFYLQESSILPDQASQGVTSDYFQIKNKINNTNKGLESIFGNGIVPSNALTNTAVSNSIMQINGAISPSDMQSSKMMAAADMVNTDSDKTVKAMQNTINNTLNNAAANPGTTGDLAFGKINTFKSVDELFMNNSLGVALGKPGAQTSDQIIAETQLEHRAFKSTLIDLNPDLDHTVAGIIKDTQDRLLSLPRYYSINKAYPTYKFYFRVEGNPQWFLFDNFYDYRAIESIRYYKDKASPAATLTMVLNNYNEILTDYSAILAKISYNENARNNEERVTNAINGKPLRSFFLEAGTQIQLKMGYDSDPANLTTVFNGFVTDVSPGERYEIACQSYGAELFTDSDMGTFTGWVCHPKQFIWWMLMSPKVKHLGGLYQATILPTGIHDYLDGFFAFDDNIFVDQTLEPGKLRLFQVYNSDNMNMWDVLQDIAASRPGFICQTIPFDDRETIFFGRPDHLYKYTQDLGVTAPYYAALTKDRKNIIQEAVNQGLNNSGNSGRTLENILHPGTNSQISKEYLNYMQWLPVNHDLISAMDSWKNTIEDNSNGSALIQFNNLLEYCRWVEILQNLQSDKNSGNIQYNKPTVGAVAVSLNSTTQALKDEIASKNNMKSSSSGNTTSRQRSITEDLSKHGPDNGDTKNINQPNHEANAPLSLLNPSVIKNGSRRTAPSGIGGIDDSIKAGIMNAQIGQPMALDIFVQDSTVLGITRIFSGSILDSSSEGDNHLEDFAKAAEILRQRNETHDDSLLNPFDSKQRIASLASQFFEKYGVINPVAMLAWHKIGVCLSAMSKTAAGSPTTVATLEGVLNSGNNVFTVFPKGEKAFISLNLPGVLLTLGNRDTSAGVDVTSFGSQNNITFNGDIFTTNLKTHQSLRQLILSTINNINPAFQELIYFIGKPPNARRFRNYHLKTSYQHIVNNEIKTNYMGMFNSIKVKYKRNDLFDYYIPVIPSLIWGDKPHSEFQIQAGDTLYDRITREATMTVENARTIGEARAYATSILAEGVRNMYRGELVILGDPDIKPTDIVFIYDDYNKMYGPIEVKSITHVMEADTGFISIIQPQAHVEPLGVSISPAQIIKDIFDTLLIPLIFLAPEVGLVEDVFAGVGSLGARILSGSAKETAEAVTETIASRASSAGSKAFNSVAGFFDSTATDIYNPQYITNFVKGFESGLKEFTSSIPITAEKASSVTSDAVLNAINAGRTPVIEDLTAASRGEIIQGLKDVIGSGDEAINKSIDTFGSRIMLTQTSAALKATAVSVATIVTDLGTGALSKFLGFGLINTLKVLAVISPIAYYQVFAGVDDSNYACPLRITPLSYNGSPYTAGLDGLTHQYGIWNHVAGQWRRFVGSVRTVGDAVSEYVTGVTSSLK